MNKIVHQAASRKGGKVRKPKGLAKLSPERRREIAAQGGRAKHEKNNRSKEETEQTNASQSRDTERLADLFGTLDEQESYKAYSGEYPDEPL